MQASSCISQAAGAMTPNCTSHRAREQNTTQQRTCHRHAVSFHLQSFTSFKQTLLLRTIPTAARQQSLTCKRRHSLGVSIRVEVHCRGRNRKETPESTQADPKATRTDSAPPPPISDRTATEQHSIIEPSIEHRTSNRTNERTENQRTDSELQLRTSNELRRKE